MVVCLHVFGQNNTAAEEAVHLTVERKQTDREEGTGDQA
jgi:hypothetical protein